MRERKQERRKEQREISPGVPRGVLALRPSTSRRRVVDTPPSSPPPSPPRYAKFDLASPAAARGMPYTGVIERPDLQQILLDGLKEVRETYLMIHSVEGAARCGAVCAHAHSRARSTLDFVAMLPSQGVVQNGVGISSYTHTEECSVDDEACPVVVALDDGSEVAGDVLIGADGIWSNVRAAMRDEPARGDGSGVSYSGCVRVVARRHDMSPSTGRGRERQTARTGGGRDRVMRRWWVGGERATRRDRPLFLRCVARPRAACCLL
jgi:2-polyprenyl-6-methoxyphenol hydroxylase-like FAD-dependent oxidoreductase